ncbi:hypothetical protein [Micromonospora sp. SL4-19]|uniref:hypothetical protein n=1 Tax=Micromonospora sp. SL4-19 TaxID=3399129 RepID=UPI003A4D8395
MTVIIPDVHDYGPSGIRSTSSHHLVDGWPAALALLGVRLRLSRQPPPSVVTESRQIRAPHLGQPVPRDVRLGLLMRDDIVLRLDRATAEDLYVALYEAGEHIAAGAAITPPTAEEAERLGTLLRHLGHALGRRCFPYCDHL